MNDLKKGCSTDFLVRSDSNLGRTPGPGFKIPLKTVAIELLVELVSNYRSVRGYG